MIYDAITIKARYEAFTFNYPVEHDVDKVRHTLIKDMGDECYLMTEVKARALADSLQEQAQSDEAHIRDIKGM